MLFVNVAGSISWDLEQMAVNESKAERSLAAKVLEATEGINMIPHAELQ